MEGPLRQHGGRVGDRVVCTQKVEEVTATSLSHLTFQSSEVASTGHGLRDHQ